MRVIFREGDETHFLLYREIIRNGRLGWREIERDRERQRERKRQRERERGGEERDSTSVCKKVHSKYFFSNPEEEGK